MYDPATQKCTYYGTGKNSKEKLPDNNFWTAYKTRDGIIWISTWQSNLYKINPYQNKPPYTNIGKTVFAFAEDNAHNLWIATNKGLMRKDSSGKEQLLLIDKDSSSYKNIILTIEKDNDNRLWVGTFMAYIILILVQKLLQVIILKKAMQKVWCRIQLTLLKKIDEGQLWLGHIGWITIDGYKNRDI